MIYDFEWYLSEVQPIDRTEQDLLDIMYFAQNDSDDFDDSVPPEFLKAVIDYFSSVLFKCSFNTETNELKVHLKEV